MSRRPATLFARTGATLAVALLLYSLLAVAVVYLYFIGPVSRQAAEDLGALLVLSAQTWVELPPATRPDFERELLDHHHLRLGEAGTPLAPATGAPPYFSALERALGERLGQTIAVGVEAPGWYGVDLPMAGHRLRLGFRSDRLGEQLPLAVLLVASGGALILLATALLLVRRLTRPLERLEAATAQVGRGAAPLPESGPRELASLARAFNRMEGEIQELLEARTTLMAGISHDLRTPLARMRLALEFLREGAEPELVAGVERDLEEMDRLLGQTLVLARGARPEPARALDLRDFLEALAGEYQAQGAAVTVAEGGPCPAAAAPDALRRVLGNLVENALRYGGEAPVELRCRVVGGQAQVAVVDRGPGIPLAQREAVFRPFQRLEHSRSRDTGGSGLGLAIVRQLCDAQGWEVALLDAAGGGLEARITLPAPPPAGAASGAA